jgi:hypothetical protein
MTASSARISLLEAMRAADALRSDIGVEDEENLDVFAVIRSLGMIVAFQPLDNLLGAIIREGSGGGSHLHVARRQRPAIHSSA